jgi:hypothetical protein
LNCPTASPLLFFNEISTFKKVVLDPKLEDIEEEGVDHHHEKELERRMALEDAQDVDRGINQHVGVLKHQPKDHELRNCKGHQPNYQLNEVDLVIDVLVQFLVSVAEEVLSVVKVEVYATL